MRNPGRFHKERALREVGRKIPAYPTAGDFASMAAVDQLAADREFLSACAFWDNAIDQAYLDFVTSLPPFQVGPELEDFAARCEQYGISAGLVALNARVPHRYTALYQLSDGTLRNIELVDKAGEIWPDFLVEVPLGDSFCQFVMRDGVFRTCDSAVDDRLDGHPYKGVMVAYHGVPVVDGSGELFGSLCHFDTEEQPMSDEEFAVLEGAAKVIAPYLIVKR